MGILPMSPTGVPPVSLLLSLSLSGKVEQKKQQHHARTGVRLMGETPMLLCRNDEHRHLLPADVDKILGSKAFLAFFAGLAVVYLL
jgi:hypothetical protein